MTNLLEIGREVKIYYTGYIGFDASGSIVKAESVKLNVDYSKSTCVRCPSPILPQDNHTYSKIILSSSDSRSKSESSSLYSSNDIYLNVTNITRGYWIEFNSFNNGTLRHVKTKKEIILYEETMAR